MRRHYETWSYWCLVTTWTSSNVHSSRFGTPHNPCVGMPAGGTGSGLVPPVHQERWGLGIVRLGKPIANDDIRWNFSTTLSLLGDARDPTYAHPLVLGRYFEKVYHQGRFPGKLPKCRPGQAAEITKECYDREMSEVCDWLRSFDDPNFCNCKILPPTSLVNPEIILDPAEYWQILDMKSVMTRDPIHPPVAQFKADRAQARVDIVSGTPIPSRPRDDPDDVDYESLYGVYYDDEGNLIPEYEDEILDLENVPQGDATLESKVSMDTEQAGHLGYLSLASSYPTGAPEPGDLKVQVSTSASGEIRRVRQVLPAPPKFWRASGWAVQHQGLGLQYFKTSYEDGNRDSWPDWAHQRPRQTSTSGKLLLRQERRDLH